MIFKKTLLALSLTAVSVFAAAAPAAPAPAATGPVNILQGVPAYVLTAEPWGFTAYTPLMDDDRVHVGGIPQGAWTGLTTDPTKLVIDFSGAPCVDKFGSCSGKPGQGATDVNTVVLYFEQAPGTEVEPSDTTLAARETYSVSLAGYKGSTLGVDFATQKENLGFFDFLGSVKGNTLAKRTFTFPTGKYSKFEIDIRHRFRIDTGSPNLVHAEAYNLPAAPAKP